MAEQKMADKKNFFGLLGMLVMVLTFSFVVAGCSTTSNGGGDSEPKPPAKLASDATGSQQIDWLDELHNYCSSQSNSLGGSHYNFIKIGLDYIRWYTTVDGSGGFEVMWKEPAGEYFPELLISSLNAYIDNLQIDSEGEGSKPANLASDANPQQALDKLNELANYCNSHSDLLGGSRFELIETGLHFIRVTISTGDCEDSVVISSLNAYIDNL
jgi:hypothetical protein